MDRFYALQAFVAVVDAGGYSAAARRINIPLATLSRRVAELETHLQAALLTRTTRKIALTHAGQQFLAPARQLLADLDAAERIAAGAHSVPQGELVITAPVVLGRLHVLPLISAFLAAFERVQVTLHLQDRVVDLLEEHIDLAVRVGHLPDSGLIARKVGAIGQIVCASPAYLQARRKPEHPRDLADHQCISFSRVSGATRWSFVEAGNIFDMRIEPRLSVNTAEAALDAAVAGGGVTRLFSYQAAAALAAGHLVALLESFAPAAAPVALVHPAGRYVPAKLRAFMDFAAPGLKQVLPQV